MAEKLFVNKLKKRVLITDLDNTLFDWFTIWYESFSSMMKKASVISGVPLEKLYEEAKPIHQLHGTAEYAFVLENLPSLMTKFGDRENLLKQLDPAIHAARSARKTHLKLYPGVYDTLSILRASRVKIVAYTESKEWYTKNRLKKLGLDFFIDHLYSPEDHSVPISDEDRTTIKFENMESFFTPSNEKKPNPKLLLDIIEKIDAKPEDCIYVGDSELRDINMACDAGVTSVFAKYGGKHFSDQKEGYELLRKVTHWTDEEVLEEKKLKESGVKHKADHEIDKFCEILEIMGIDSECTPSISDEKKVEIMHDAWKTTIDTQRHFNDVAMKIRHFGFVILAAVVGAAGLSLRSGYAIDLFDYNVPIGTFIMLFGAFVWIGIWFLDTKWYSPFLLGSVYTGINLEKQLNKVIPDCFTHSSDIKAQSNEVTILGFKVNSSKRSSIFHFAMIGVLLLLSFLILCTSVPIKSDDLIVSSDKAAPVAVTIVSSEHPVNPDPNKSIVSALNEAKVDATATSNSTDSEKKAVQEKRVAPTKMNKD
jgi:phosphoglycolate phosphatase